MTRASRMLTPDPPQKLLRALKRFDRADLADKLVGLSFCPEYHANQPRILTLLRLTTEHASGSKKASQGDLAELLNSLRDHPSYATEDPPEDAFVVAVSTPDGQYRIFNNVHSGADFYLQRTLDAVLSRDFEGRDELAAQARALLSVSDAIAAKAGYEINTFVESDQWRTAWPVLLPRLRNLGSAAHLSWDELGFGADALRPFLLNAAVDDDVRTALASPQLSRRPLVLEKDGIWAPIPSLIAGALILHLVDTIVHAGLSREARETFHQTQLARWLVYDLPLRQSKPLLSSDMPLPEDEIDVPGFTQALVRFDEDKIAHLIIIESGWNTPATNPREQRPMPPRAEQALLRHITKAQQTVQAQQGVSRGLTLVIYDSPGWDMTGPKLDDLNEHWFSTDISSYALSALFSDPRFSFLDLWKMQRDMRAFEKSGLVLQIYADPLAYWSVWQAFGATFWPEGVDVRAFGALLADTSKIAGVVVDGRVTRGAHAARLPSGERLRVERWAEVEAPEADRLKPVFLDPIGLPLGELRGVCESAKGHWWVTLARPPYDLEERRFFYLLWQAALEWLRRIADSAGNRLPERDLSIEVRLLSVPSTIEDAPSEIELVVADGIAVVTIVLPPNFIDALLTPDNSGEAILIGALVDAIAAAQHLTISPADRSAWIGELTSDPNLKMIHANYGPDAGFVTDIGIERTALRVLQLADLAAATRHMHDALAGRSDSGVNAGTHDLSGMDAVGKALNAVADVHWLRCRALLSELDRTQTLSLIGRLIESAHRRRVDAERGALARASFYSEGAYDPEASIAMRDAAFRAYRIVAEMALCEAPLTGGRTPGLSDVDTLAAEVTALIQAAHISDAARYELLAPVLSFNANGAIDTETLNAETFMRDYSIASIAESIELDKDGYPNLFAPRPTEDEIEANDDGFLAAFEAEFSLTLPAAVSLVQALQEIAVESGAEVVILPRSQLILESTRIDPEVTPALVDAFLGSFVLSTRPKWDTPPPGYKTDDIWPWLFERRLSLMMRPVLIVSGDTDPQIIYGIRHIEMGFQYASQLLETGVWPKGKLRSTLSRAYVDAEVNRRGDAFEVEVAKIFTDAVWRTFTAVQMKRFNAPKSFGDVDVLAVSPDQTSWIVVECKWFGAARTPREVANWLQDFRGHEGDKLFKHIRRFEWITAHASAIAALLGVPAPTCIIPKIVTTSPVPLAFQADLPANAEVWTRRELVAFLAPPKSKSRPELTLLRPQSRYGQRARSRRF